MGKFLSIIVVLGITIFLQSFYKFAYIPVIALMMIIGFMNASEQESKFKKKEEKWKELAKFYEEMHDNLEKYLKKDNELKMIFAKIKDLLS